MNSVIYYFSATGNSLKVARDLAQGVGDTQMVRITRHSLAMAHQNEYQRVGIVFPVYYYGMPLMVTHFVEQLQLNPGAYVYAAATCGGSVGAALKQLKRILEGKGASLSAAFTVVMPDNYQVMYAPPPLKKRKQLFEQEKKKTVEMAAIVTRSEKKVWDEKGALAAKLLGGLIARTFHPKGKDQHFWTDERCNGCSICFKVCPSGNIIMRNQQPQWLHQCEHCLGCMHWCPQTALQYKKGTLKRERYHHPDVQVDELFIEA